MKGDIDGVLVFKNKNIPVVCKRMIENLSVNLIAQLLVRIRIDLIHKLFWFKQGDKTVPKRSRPKRSLIFPRQTTRIH